MKNIWEKYLWKGIRWSLSSFCQLNLDLSWWFWGRRESADVVRQVSGGNNHAHLKTTRVIVQQIFQVSRPHGYTRESGLRYQIPLHDSCAGLFSRSLREHQMGIVCSSPRALPPRVWLRLPRVRTRQKKVLRVIISLLSRIDHRLAKTWTRPLRRG